MRHKQPDKLDSLIGWAATFIVAALILMFLGLLSSVADAAPVCRVQKQVVVQQAVAYPPVYFAINKSLQQEAAATLQFRHSEEYIELQQLRGFKAGVDAVASSVARSSSPPTAVEGESPAAVEGPNTPAPPRDPYAMLKATCAKCHSGDSPKGDLWLDGSVSLDGPDAATKRDDIVSAIRTGRMPPNLPEGERLPLEKREAIEDEIHGVEVVEGEQ